MRALFYLLIIMLATNVFGGDMDYVKLVNTCNDLFDKGKTAISIDIAYESSASVNVDNKVKITWNNAVLEESDQGHAINIQLQLEESGFITSAMPLTIAAGQPCWRLPGPSASTVCSMPPYSRPLGFKKSRVPLASSSPFSFFCLWGHPGRWPESGWVTSTRAS